MFNKFKINEIVICNGIGKGTEKKFHRIGIVIEKDYYYKDYCIRFEDGTEEWFDEEDLNKV